MTREKIDKITSNKIFLIVISCLASILLWLYVVNFENTDIESTITGISVTYLGEEDILSDRQLIITNKKEQTVSLRLYGKRSIVSSIDKDDILVTVDLTDVKTTGTIERVYNIQFADGIKADDIYIDKNPTYVTVVVDRLSSKQLDIKSEINITVAEGYMAEPAEISPVQLTVSGPGEVISEIAYAGITVTRENLSKTVVNNVDYKLYDADGNEIISNEIEVSHDTVEVTIPVVMCKDVVLTAELIDGGGAKKEDAVVTIEPAAITLSGDAELLSSMNQISLGRIDLSSFQNSKTETFTIPIANNLNNISGVTEATVTVSLKNLVTKRLIVSNIEFTNVSEGYIANPVTQYLEVVIRGPEQIVELVNAYNVHIIGDLSSLGQAVGRYAVDTKIYIDGYSEAGAVGSYKVVVSLEEEQGEEAESQQEE